MLVLSRRVHESIIVNEVIVVTVAAIPRAAVELSLATIEGGELSRLHLSKNESAIIGSGVRVTLVEATTEKVRLGIELPPGVSISRR